MGELKTKFDKQKAELDAAAGNAKGSSEATPSPPTPYTLHIFV